MKRTALLIPCLIVLFGCQREEAKPPTMPPAPVATEPTPPVASAPVSAAHTPQAPGSGVTEVEKKPAPAVPEQKPAAEAKPPVPAPVTPAPKAEAVPPPAETTPQPAVSEAAALALAKKYCFTCHQVDKKVLGPSWRDVANKYRGDAAAQGRLENVIAKGGKGAWGTLAMSAQPQVKEADRTLLVRYILNLK